MRFEVKNDLFNHEILGIKYWQFVRYNVISSIRSALFNLRENIIGFPTQLNKVNHKERYKIFSRTKNVDLLIFNHPRRTLIGQVYVNMHSDYLAEKLAKKYRIHIVEEPFQTENINAKISHFENIYNEFVSYTDLIEERVARKIMRFQRSVSKEAKQYQEEIQQLAKKIMSAFPLTNYDTLFSILYHQTLYIKFAQKYYEKLLLRAHPKAVILFYSPSHTKTLICAVARKLKIHTIDLQHGMMTDLEPLFYRVPYRAYNLDIYPDYIFSFGNNSIRTTFMDRRIRNKIIPTGNVTLQKRFDELSKTFPQSDKKYILIISQQTISQPLTDFALKLSKHLPTNYHILYKLHPFDNEQDFGVLKNHRNITILTSKDKDVNYYQKISALQIGVYSTALYEGLLFNLPTFVITNMFGSSYTKGDLQKLPCVKCITSYEEVINSLDKLDKLVPTKKEIEKFWCYNAFENFENNLSKILDNIN